ncbi:potassium transporter 3-like [Dorcoceras hygrometricum]|uniref:Potassium transporter 3-like n=1 Tax=Dorcoceras hygrometricum TaxID=472368 RepID=A0A2Z7AH49_9LAMI|nr:potassium transporter 3-like [Dorcoceras hygrometricum]
MTRYDLYNCELNVYGAPPADASQGSSNLPKIQIHNKTAPRGQTPVQRIIGNQGTATQLAIKISINHRNPKHNYSADDHDSVKHWIPMHSDSVGKSQLSATTDGRTADLNTIPQHSSRLKAERTHYDVQVSDNSSGPAAHSKNHKKNLTTIPQHISRLKPERIHCDARLGNISGPVAHSKNHKKAQEKRSALAKADHHQQLSSKLKSQRALVRSDNHEQLLPKLKSLRDAVEHLRSDR